MESAGILRCDNVWLVLFARRFLSPNRGLCMKRVCASFSIATTVNGPAFSCEPLPPDAVGPPSDGCARSACLTLAQVHQLAAVHERPLQAPAPEAAQRPEAACGLAQLALELLHERELRYERRITALEDVLHQIGRVSLCPQPLPHPEPPLGTQEHAQRPHQGRQLNPAEQLARCRLPPLIEYGAQGTYVIESRARR
jgi:hypothetical protein